MKQLGSSREKWSEAVEYVLVIGHCPFCYSENIYEILRSKIGALFFIYYN